MDSVLFFFLILCQGLVNCFIFAVEENSTSSRSTYFMTGENKRLEGHVVKRLESASLISCNHLCLRNSWCTSTNFEAPSSENGRGTCELNKHGPINTDSEFYGQQGVTFSVLQKGCLFTGCLNGGSCVNKEKNKKYLCLCTKAWTGDKCERKLDVRIPDPIVLYPLNGQYGTRALANRQPQGTPVGVTLAAGPNGKASGSYQFTGQANSHIEFPNNGGLDTERSITMLCWLYPQNTDGPIFNYKTSGSWGVHMWVVSGKLFARFTKRNYQFTQHLATSESLALSHWQYVGASYDYNTGVASLWLDAKQVVQTNIGAGMTLGTQDDVRMGAKIGDARYFRGRIAAMQIYDIALTKEQVKAVENVSEESCP